MGSIISNFSQAVASVTVPHVKIPCRGEAFCWGGTPMTLPLAACACWAAAMCVCTVRATPTVVAKASKPTAAEISLILCVIIEFLESVPVYGGKIVNILLRTRLAGLTLNCSSARACYWNIAAQCVPPGKTSGASVILLTEQRAGTS